MRDLNVILVKCGKHGARGLLSDEFQFYDQNDGIPAITARSGYG